MSLENGSAATPVPLAIVGIGCLFPKAQDARAYWFNIKNGVDTIGPVPPSHWDPEDYLDPDPKAPDRTYAARGGFLGAVDFRPLDFGIAPNDLEATDTSQLLGLVAARQALIDAGYGPDKQFDRNRVSVLLGVTGTLELVIPLGARLGHPRWRKALLKAGIPPQKADQIIAEIGDSYVGWQENSFPGLLGNVVAGRIANRLDLGGTNCVVDAACASSLSAIHLASLELAAGRCDVAVTGGVDTFNDIFMFMCFSKTPALSPTGDSRPFDANGDGTILGEGLGIVVLKRLADAQRDGNRIYAVIRSVGSSSDGKGNAIYAPSATGQMKALRSAYQLAGIGPESIELIEGHGTGTRVGDAVEVSALSEVYRSARPNGTWCALGSVKSQIGHTKAAAGAAGLIKAALALHARVLPPTIKIKEPIDTLRNGNSPFYLNTQKRPWIARPDQPRRAAVSAFGFGGSNFHCVLEEHDAGDSRIDWEGDVEILAFSGTDARALKREVETWRVPGSWKEIQKAAGESRARNAASASSRLLLVVNRDGTDLPKLIDAARGKMTSDPDARFWRLPEGAYFGSGPALGRLAVLFPGQGSQYAGMLRDLSCVFPPMRKALADANRVFERLTGNGSPQRLSDLIYPFPAFSKEERDAQEQRLRDTQVAQPAIGAVSIGALKIFEDFGVAPDAYAGHSYGELPALCAAGCFDADALHTMSRLRGHLMASYHGANAGSMLAVHASAATVEAVLREEALDLVVANRNSPNQSVLSGHTVEIDRAVGLLDRRDLRHTKLAVAAAFHSPLVAAAQKPFREALGELHFRTACKPVFANASAREYPADPDAMRELLAEQLARPVDFVSEIGGMAEGGVRTFLEVGPGSTLTKLASAILGAPENAHLGGWDAFALDASSGKRSGMLDLAHALARLAARGHAVNLALWQQRDPREPAAAPLAKASLTVPICGANYVQPKKTVPAPAILSENSASLRRTQRLPAETPLPVLQSASTPAPVPSAPPSQAAKPMPAQRTIHSPTEMNGTEPRSLETPMASAALAQALQASQQSLAAFAKLQEQTAQLHKQFLENQEAAQRTLQMLVEQQSALFRSPNGMGHANIPRPGVSNLESSKRAAVHKVETGDAAPTQTWDASGSEPAGRSPESNARATAPQSPGGSGLSPQVPAPAPRPQTPVPGPQLSAPAVQSPAPKPQTPAPRPQASDSTPQTVLLAVVAEKTGYPAEMLTPEMALDADLGIDSIKRVEIFSALQEKLPEAPAVKPEHLGTLHTLRDVIEFLSSAGGTSSPRVSETGPAPQLPGPAASAVKETLFQIVSDKTGYPTEMLAAEMALDADLGIDSIKRVEIFSALQEKLPEAPAVKPEHLGSLHTLGDVVAFLAGRSSGPAPSTARPGKPEPRAGLSTTPAAVPAFQPEPLTSLQPETVAGDQTQPGPVAKIPSNLESNGHPLPPHATPKRETTYRVVIKRSVLHAVPLQRAESPRIQLTAGATIVVVADQSPLTTALIRCIEADGCRARLVSWDDYPTESIAASGLLLVAPGNNTFDDLPLRAFRWLRNLGPTIKRAAASEGTVIATVSRLGGSFGLENLDPERDARHGALAGLVKTAAHEWPEAACKAIDVEPNCSVAIAASIWEEATVRGPAEVGISRRRKVVLELHPEQHAETAPPLLTSSDIVLITGGARGVTAAAAIAIAEKHRPTLVLMGRTPIDAPEYEWLNGNETEASIKQVLAHQLPAPVSPRRIEEEYRRIVARQEIRRNIETMEKHGSRVIYKCVNVADASAVAAAIQELSDRVTCLIHGAGVLADRRIDELTDEQFQAVYSTKVEGLEALLEALRHAPLKAIVLFSSSTGRFGRVGQAAYAAANEALNKLAHQQASFRPECKVAAINWGPWDGGMVTPALRKLFASEGVGVIPLERGAEILLNELSADKTAVETTIIAAGSPMIADTPIQKHDAAPAPLQLAFEQTVSVSNYPVLRSHVLDGRAVLPLALHLELLAHAALHDNPGYAFHGVNDLRLLQGVMLEGADEVPLQIFTGRPQRSDGNVQVQVELRGRRGAKEAVHSRGEIVLVQRLPEAPQAEPLPPVGPYPHAVADAYRRFLFHGPDLKGIEQLDGIGPKGLVGMARTAPLPSAWLRQPMRSGWIADPLVLDAAFQTMILWTKAERGAASLPCFVGRYRQFRRTFPAGRIGIGIRITSASGSQVRSAIDFIDSAGGLAARIEDYECTVDKNLERAFRNNQLQEVASAPAGGNR